MTVSITSPIAFLNAIRFSTIDQTQLTRMRYVPNKNVIELITQSRNSQVFIRGTLYISQEQQQSQIITNAPSKISMFTDFSEQNFDFTVPAKQLLRAVQGLANLVKFTSPLPPVFKISFPDEDSPFLSLSGAISQLNLILDRDSDIKSFYQIHTTTETVDFPYTFSPSTAKFYAVISSFALFSLIDSLNQSVKLQQTCKIIFTQDGKDMLIQTQDEAGVNVVAQMPNHQVGKSWILESVKFCDFEGVYTFSGVRAVAGMLKFCAETDAVVVLGCISGEIMFRIPVGQGDRISGQFVVVLAGIDADQ
ncbi:hypothetical protein SS50377_25373 [Spironucleus salmonicida]|uniref:Uncharacterized protein n=1 Tax=Spironucleus salmonicida TaxID=348837 RepID=V6LDK6_9EUKA|nr:hypothetical protein SS50377_25373 [Spironucleus salmonicida]|eukprot:EST41751.1 Hypothetical protein SS50377_18584 [Spironucleus salmonicida]